MGRPAKNGIYDFRRSAQRCNKSCKDYASCTVRIDPFGKCAKRDRLEYYVKYVRVTDTDGTTKRKEIYGRTVEELTAKVDAFLAKQEENKKEQEREEEPTLGQWADMWRDAYLVEGKMKKSSVRANRSMLRLLTDGLRNKKLSELLPIDFEQHFSSLLESGGRKGEGLSTKTLRNYRTMLVSCLDRAVENRKMEENVLKKVKPVPLAQKEIVCLTKDEIRRLLSVAESGEYYGNPKEALKDSGCVYLIRQWAMAIRLTLATGLRWGETFGMSWSNVDFPKSVVHVRDNLQNGELTTPKTRHSKRDISVDADTMKLLAGWKRHQVRYAEEVGDKYDNELGLVFTNSAGKPMNYDNFRMRYYNPIVAKAGLPDGVTFHSLRHTHATQLLAGGVDPKTVSRRLGHSSVGFTLTTYAHVLAEMDSKATAVISSVIYGKDNADDDKTGQ